MKTIIQITLSFLLLFTTLVNGQIAFERSYTNSVYYTELSPGEQKLFLMDVPFGECRIYNLDHSLYKTIKITLDQGYFLYDISYVARNLINDDNEIELLYMANKYFQNATPPYYQYMVGAVNESGTSLLKVDQGTYYDIQNVNGQNKLLIWLYDNSTYPYFKGTNIYSLNSVVSGSSAKKSGKVYQPAYPNPAGEKVTIPLNLPKDTKKAFVHILSADGILLKEYKVDNLFKELIPDISDLPAGIYYYSIFNENREVLQSNKFSLSK